MVKRANRIVFGALSTVTVVVLLFGYRTSTEGPENTVVPGAIAPAQADDSGAVTQPSTEPTTEPSTEPAATPSAGASSKAAASTVTGDAEDTQWGPVQVQLTISDGRITDVGVPVYPNGNGRDAEINSYALPQLIQETISAQSANIDMVSGATVTSDGYLRSLQSALDKAGL
jgi:uncharacterized protein with FMN-binding domain